MPKEEKLKLKTHIEEVKHVPSSLPKPASPSVAKMLTKTHVTPPKTTTQMPITPPPFKSSEPQCLNSATGSFLSYHIWYNRAESQTMQQTQAIVLPSTEAQQVAIATKEPCLQFCRANKEL